MRFISALAATALTALTAMPAAADGMRYYPVHTHVNYCPAGLQPISVGGVICCGRPNTHVTWNQMKQHPVAKRTYTYQSSCPPGQKGCD